MNETIGDIFKDYLPFSQRVVKPMILEELKNHKPSSYHSDRLLDELSKLMNNA